MDLFFFFLRVGPESSLTRLLFLTNFCNDSKWGWKVDFGYNITADSANWGVDVSCSHREYYLINMYWVSAALFSTVIFLCMVKSRTLFLFFFFIFLFMLTNFSLFENPKRKFQSYLVPWVATLRSTNYKSRPHFDYFWCQTFLLTSFLFTSICKNIHAFVARGILYKGEPPPQK